jgi:hypothetical protein
LGAYSRRKALIAAVGLSVAVVAACEEQTPTAIGDGELPGEPITVEVRIPWSDFASNLEVFGGYGSPEDLGRGVVANQFAGTLDARTLIRFAAYPTQATVRDSTGAERPDTDLTFLGGRLVAFFDTLASTNTAPVTLGLGATQTEWDATTTTWAFAVDTINDERPWGEPGAGPVAALGTATWDSSLGDSVLFAVDSTMVAAWGDTTDLGRGGRIELLDVGARLQMNGAVLRLDVRPSINPDTVVEVTVLTRNVTFVYDPFPQPPPDGVRIGGAPAWRTVLDVDVPPELSGPAEFCAVVSCPHTLEPAEISYAALVLTSRATDPAFQPTDSIGLDVRPVFSRAAMPKAPLGGSLVADLLGRRVAPEAFGSAPGELIEIPVTSFARDLLRGTDETGNPAPSTLALLSVFEPSSIAFASFEGPGSPNEPFLRLILTIGPAVRVP